MKEKLSLNFFRTRVKFTLKSQRTFILKFIRGWYSMGWTGREARHGCPDIRGNRHRRGWHLGFFATGSAG